MPISATILINVERGSSAQVAQAILAINGVEKVFSVAGRYDLIVLVNVKGMEELSDISNKGLDGISEIKSVETLVSMKVFSEKDLDANWNVGM